MSGYTAFLNIQFEHEYYADNIQNMLMVSPSSSSVRLLKNAGMLLKQENGAFKLFGNQESIDYLLAYLADYLQTAPVSAGEPTLLFIVNYADPDLSIATENMPTLNENYWFLSNCTMHENTANTLLDVTTLDHTQHKPLFESSHFSAIHSWRASRDFIAVIEISLFKLLEALSAQTSLDFRIKIAARLAYWQYFVRPEPISELRLQIQDTENEVSFIPQGDVIIDNQTFVSFLSDRLISFRNIYHKRFYLHLSKDDEQNLPPELLPAVTVQSFQVRRVNSELIPVANGYLYL